MAERPVLFSGPMVRAILEGRKTQTRRIVKNPERLPEEPRGYEYNGAALVRDFGTMGRSAYPIRCPYGAPGGILWVRETWVEVMAVSPATDGPMEIGPGEWLIEDPTFWIDDQGRKRWHYSGRVLAYRASSAMEFCDGDGFTGEFANRDDMPRWHPSIHMPRWASRIDLRVISIRVERLQAISREDVLAEGCEPPRCPKCGYTRGDCHLHMDHARCGEPTPPHEVTAYIALWNAIHGEGAWDLNPWVWVVEFEKAVVKNERAAV